MTENRQWVTASVGGLTVVAIAAALPPTASAIVLIVLQLAVFGVVARGLAHRDPLARSRPYGWWLLAISCGIGLLASVAFIGLPSDASDGAWPVAIAARQLTFLVGLAAIMGFRRGSRVDHHSLDAGIVAVGITVLAWAFVIQPRFGEHRPDPSHYILGTTFAVMDFLLLWSLARVATSSAFRMPTMLLLAAGGLPVLVTNLFANSDVGRHGFREMQPGGSVYLAWQVCGILIAAAALQPSARSGRTPGDGSIDRISRWRFATLVLVALLTPAVPVIALSLVAHAIPNEALVPLVGLSILTCVLLLLLVVRLTNVVRLEARRADAMDHQSATMARQAETLRRTLDSQHALQIELAWRATHDPLTRLGNRALLAERLKHALGQRRGTPGGALLVVDLDDFKAVNDSLGHPAGDLLLIQVGQRLTSTAAGSDNVARLGGDEFALVIEGCAAAECREIARNVVEELRAAYVVGERHHQLTASVGLVILSGDYHDAASALRDADLALYSAKRAGGNEVAEFVPHMRVAQEMHTELAAGVRTAISENRLRVAYQPIIDLASGRTVAVEALLRWRAASGRSFSPGEFIAVAEDIGLVADVGAEVLDTAARDVAVWNAHHSVSVNVNVSGRQLVSTDFASEVLRTLDRHTVSPSALVLEITETVLIQASGAGDCVMQNLNELRENGVRVAVDDFGTGYSSLAYLQRLPIDILKVDRMFTAALDDPDELNVRFVGAILGLGTSLGLPVVAEGVESERQATFLADLGCPLAQGFYFARPSPASEVVEHFARTGPPLGGQ